MNIKKIFFFLNALLLSAFFIVFFFLINDIFKIHDLLSLIKTQPKSNKDLKVRESKLNNLNELTAKYNLYLVDKKVSFYKTNSSAIIARHGFVFYGQYLDFLSLVKHLEKSDTLLKVYNLKLSDGGDGNLKIEVKVDVLHKRD